MHCWDDIRAWRKSTRNGLLEQRERLTTRQVRRAASMVADKLLELAVLRDAGSVGFYWAFRGELDLRPLLRDLAEAGVRAALPVVVEKNQPLEFWAWRPEMKLEHGMWDTRVPPVREPLEPEVLLIPLVGFDMAGYRLGQGGGYYDRTLAAAAPKPVAIGVGYKDSCLQTIYPQPHDIPMDIIVTEGPVRHPVGVHNDEPDSAAGQIDSSVRYASSPCFLHELG